MVPAGIGAGFVFAVTANNVFGQALGYLFSYDAPTIASVSPVSFIVFSIRFNLLCVVYCISVAMFLAVKKAMSQCHEF